MITLDTMQALFIDEPNGPFVSRRIPLPVPGPKEVLVKIAASGVNPLDIKIRQGHASHARHTFPAILGLDMAGTIVALGSEVSRFRLGDEVLGMTGGVGNIQGSLAEYAAVDADLLAHKPVRLSMREAAALPLIFITAWEGLVDRAKVNSEKTVLVHGGAGGVGHMAVQIASAQGSRVYTTVSHQDFEHVRQYGAIPIDYQATPVESYVENYTGNEGFDIIYDTVGGAVLDSSFAAVRAYGGHVVSCLGWGTHSLAPLSFRGATYSGVFTLMPLLAGLYRKHHGEILLEAVRLFESGLLKIRMSPQSFSLQDAEAAHELVSSENANGKVVIEINS